MSLVVKTPVSGWTLIDEKYPFWQVPSFVPKKWRSWTALAVEFNADTAKVLFDHANDAEPGSISLASTARWLLATQTFAVSTGKSEISHTGTAPSAGSVLAIPIGQTLHDTLLFCLVPKNRTVMESDLPIWEKEPDSLEYLKTKIRVIAKKGKEKDRTIERQPSDIVDMYTWRTRSVIIRESPNGTVSEIGFASGVGYLDSMVSDPMIGHSIKEISDKETKEKVKKKLAIQFEEKGVWRDFDSLLPDGTDLAPKVIDHAAALSRIARERAPIGVIILGQKYYPPRPNVAFWRAEHFVLPEAISGDCNLRFEIRQILDDAEKAGDSLEQACNIYARAIMGHGERKVEKEDVFKFVQQMPVLSHYWSTLETNFHKILRSYRLGYESEDIRSEWLSYIRAALLAAWRLHSSSVSTADAWAIRALIKAEKPVRDKLILLNEEIKNLAPEKEEP